VSPDEPVYLNTSGNPLTAQDLPLLDRAAACAKCGSKVSWYGYVMQYPIGPDGKNPGGVNGLRRTTSMNVVAILRSRRLPARSERRGE
jgi:hypothetical protein